MNKSIGIFLLASGGIGWGGGSSTGDPTSDAGTGGQYWSSTDGKRLLFYNGSVGISSDYLASGLAVRCVK